MSLQPGVGFSFTNSSHGTTFDINAVYTDPMPTVPLEQFKVVMYGNNFYFTQGRTISRVGVFTGGCLTECNLNGMAVYPTASKTAAPVAIAGYIDDGASFELVPPTAPATTKYYNFSIILNQKNVNSGTLFAGIPYAALMEVDGDAYTKTTPGFDESGCDRQNWITTFQYVPVSVPILDPPYEVNGNLEIDQVNYLVNYNCQRLNIALIYWDDATSSWGVTQHLLGPVTIPYSAFYSGVYRYYDDGAFTPPSYFTEPDYSAEQANWEGNYSDSDKWDGTGINPTTQIPL